VANQARIRFAQARESLQKPGNVGCVKQRLLAELDAFEVTSFYCCIERGSADTEQFKGLADAVGGLGKPESTGVNRIGACIRVSAPP